MASPPQTSKLPRTDVASFLRSVGAELRAADEFLCRTGASGAAPQPAAAAAAPLLLQAAPAASAVAAVPPPAIATSVMASGSKGAAAATAEAEVASLMGLMLPQQLAPAPLAPAAAAEAAAAPAQAGQWVSEEEQSVHAVGRPAAPTHASIAPQPAADSAPAVAARSVQLRTAPGAVARSAAAQGTQSRPGEQQTPAELRHSRAKVLSWLSHSDDSPCDAIPAVHTAATTRQAAAAQRACQADGSWPPPLAQRAAAPQVRSPTQRLPPADYCEQLQLAAPPRKLLLVRPACQVCGQAAPACSCAVPVGAAPLRLLRPRQPAYVSPSRHRASGSGQQAKAQSQQCSTASAGGSAPIPSLAGQGACVSIGTIQNAYFGDGSMLQRGSGAGAAGALGQPAAVPPLACLSPPPAAAAGKSSDSASMPQLDVWAAYLAARRQAAAEAAAGAAPALSQGGSGPLAELRGIAQRIHSMQGHISSFLLRQHGGPGAVSGAPLHGAPSGGSRQLESSVVLQQPPAVVLPSVLGPTAAQSVQHASASAGQARDTSSLFTDDFILSMQMGTDWRRLERAALEAAAGQRGGEGAGAAGAAERGRRGGSAADEGNGALQRLKQTQRVVTAERVGRQVRRAP